jgi:hypothetical protein
MRCQKKEALLSLLSRTSSPPALLRNHQVLLRRKLSRRGKLASGRRSPQNVPVLDRMATARPPPATAVPAHEEKARRRWRPIEGRDGGWGGQRLILLHCTDFLWASHFRHMTRN